MTKRTDDLHDHADEHSRPIINTNKWIAEAAIQSLKTARLLCTKSRMASIAGMDTEAAKFATDADQELDIALEGLHVLCKRLEG